MYKEDRAREILDKGLIVFRGIQNYKLKFIVKGREKKYYEVSRDLREPKWYCPCKNSVFSKKPCSHILACEIYTISHDLLEKCIDR